MKDNLVDNKGRKGRMSEENAAFYPVPDAISKMPDWYGGMLEQIKECVTSGRTHVMWEANAMMTMMYYHIGKSLLQQNQAEGWGARVIDRLSADLKTEFPEMKGFSPRNLKYMQRFAKLWPDETIVQRSVAQLPWRHIICLMEKVEEPNRRLVYAMAAIRNGWSHNRIAVGKEQVGNNCEIFVERHRQTDWRGIVGDRNKFRHL